MVPTRKYIAVESCITGVYHTNGVYYQGQLVKYQLEGNTYHGKRYMRCERDPLTDYQNFLYRRALYGLRAFPQEEVKYMHWEKKKRIIKVQKRARKVVNLLKQEIVIRCTNSLFSLLHNSTLARDLVKNFSEPDPDMDDDFSLKELNLTKVDIANKLIEVGILPKNFYELKKDPDVSKRLPRLNEPANRVPVLG